MVNLDAARALARSLLADHDLHEWNFAFNRRKRAFGRCDYARRRVLLSDVLTERNGEAEVGVNRSSFSPTLFNSLLSLL